MNQLITLEVCAMRLHINKQRTRLQCFSISACERFKIFHNESTLNFINIHVLNGKINPNPPSLSLGARLNTILKNQQNFIGEVVLLFARVY
jgi:hypothetical protein